LEEMGPRDGGVVGEGADEPERGERAFVAGTVGMRRSEEAKASEERRRSVGGASEERRRSVGGASEERRRSVGGASEERRRSVGGDGKEEGWRRRPQGMGSEPEVGKPSNPCKCGKVCGG
jgi:hypothetical protein